MMYPLSHLTVDVSDTTNIYIVHPMIRRKSTYYTGMYTISIGLLNLPPSPHIIVMVSGGKFSPFSCISHITSELQVRNISCCH